MALSRKRIVDILRIALALIVVAAVVVALVRNWAAVSRHAAEVEPAALAAALALAVIGPVLAMFGWRRLLADLGSPLHVAPAGGIYFVGQLGKYLPGSVWSVVAQAEMGARLDIPRRRSGVVALIAIGLGLLTGLIVGLPALPVLLSSSSADNAAWLVLAIPLVVVACWPRLLNLLISKGLRVLRRDPLEHDLSGRAIVVTVVLFIGSWLCFGLQTWILSESIAGSTATGSIALVGVSGYALAGLIGQVAIIAPAGVGVRDGLLVLLLSTAMPSSAAFAVVLLSRFAVTLGDVVCAGAGWLYARSHHLVSTRPGAPAIDAASDTGPQLNG